MHKDLLLCEHIYSYCIEPAFFNPLGTGSDWSVKEKNTKNSVQ